MYSKGTLIQNQIFVKNRPTLLYMFLNILVHVFVFQPPKKTFFFSSLGTRKITAQHNTHGGQCCGIRGDIFRVQTCRVSQTMVFRYRISGVECVRSIVKHSVVPIPDEHYYRKKLFFNISDTI
jgi:hypothetical protein